MAAGRPSFAAVVSGQSTNEFPVSPRSLSKSFFEVFDNKGKTQPKIPSTFRGEPAIFFSKEEVAALSSPFRFTLIGKFSRWRPPMEIIRKFFTSLGLKSLKSVGLIHDKHVVIFINQEEDYSRLLLRSTWYIAGAPMKMLKWSPDFIPSFESPVVPVWVGFPGLPLHFFEKTALFNIASLFGAPLRMDQATANLTRPSVARVCIDMDISKPRKDCFWIGEEKQGYWQEVVFENPPVYCNFCKSVGHGLDSCVEKNADLKKELEEKKRKDSNIKEIEKEKEKDPVIPSADKETSKKMDVLIKNNSLLAPNVQEDEWTVHRSRKWRKKNFPVALSESAAATEAAATTAVEVVPMALPVTNQKNSYTPLIASSSNTMCSSSSFSGNGKKKTGETTLVVNNSGSLDVLCQESGPLDQGRKKNLNCESQPLVSKLDGSDESSLSPFLVNQSGPLVPNIFHFPPLDHSQKEMENFSGQRGIKFGKGVVEGSPPLAAPLVGDRGDGVFPGVRGCSEPRSVFGPKIGPEFSKDIDKDLLGNIGPKNIHDGPIIYGVMEGDRKIFGPSLDNSLSRINSPRDNEVSSQFSLISLKSSLLSFLAKKGIILQHNLESGLIEFLKSTGPKFFDEDAELNISGPLIHKRLISFLLDLDIIISKKLTKALLVFFKSEGCWDIILDIVDECGYVRSGEV